MDEKSEDSKAKTATAEGMTNHAVAESEDTNKQRDNIRMQAWPMLTYPIILQEL